MDQKIDLTRLKGVEILFKDDLYDLGKFVLKAFDARWAGTGSRARPTLHGLARIYASVLNCASKPLEEAIEAQGLPLAATVDNGSNGSPGSRPRIRRVRQGRHRP
jgi:hypothetical protein